MTSEINWLFDESSMINSITSRNISDGNLTIFYNNMTFKCQEIEDTFQLFNTSMLPSFPYCNILNSSNSPLYYINATLGLKFFFKDIKYSIIHQLKHHNIINHLSFSITNQSQAVYYGGIAPIATKDKYKSYCSVLGKKGNWNYRLTSVKMTDDKGKEICRYDIPNKDDDSQLDIYDI